ncbi:phage tail protein [Chitinophaga sp. Hz27]|uniref:phage tail protein n=1 Tax=Chitinophaga sp. Hz27 TaxID=3347169 RepID=UPI0035DC1153
MAQPFIGEIRIFAGNFAPAGWQFCAGQLLPISEYEPLFQVIGTYYGGDGEATFGLPNLQGVAAMHAGTLNALTFSLAERTGAETVTLVNAQMPSHQHKLNGSVFIPAYGENPASQKLPDNNYPAIIPGQQQYTNSPATGYTGNLNVAPQVTIGTNTTMLTVDGSGGSQPFEIMQPYVAINFIISLFGIFPSQT